jgi:hypothetical protein
MVKNIKIPVTGFSTNKNLGERSLEEAIFKGTPSCVGVD